MRGPLSAPQETTRLQAEDGRGRAKAPGDGPPRAPDGHAAPEARDPLQRGRGWGERIHDLPRAQAAGMEPKKRSMGAGERDEFLRAAWRARVARQIDADRLVFLRTRWAPTFRFRRCTLGRPRGSGPTVAPRGTGARTSRCLPASRRRASDRAWRSRAPRRGRSSKPTWSRF